MDRNAAVDALAAEMVTLRAKMLRELNANLFADDGSYRPAPAIPLRARLSWIRGYFSTLWKALRGVELTEAEADYDY